MKSMFNPKLGVRKIQSLIAEFSKFSSSSQYQLDHLSNQNELRKKRQLAQVNEQAEIALKRTEDEFSNRIFDIRKQCDETISNAGYVACDWSNEAWESWLPQFNAPVPRHIRWGTYTAISKNKIFQFPAFLPMISDSHIVVETTVESKTTANKVVESMILRLFATLPPGKLRCTFIDPVGLGQNAASFMHLADYDPELITSRIWTESTHIERQLTALTEHTENVIQKYLRNEYKTIEEFNEQAGEIAEPYRLLVVFDFPTNFDETTVRRLTSIAQNGPRCGIYTLVVVDKNKPLPYGFSLDEIEQGATILKIAKEKSIWTDSPFSELDLQLDQPPSIELTNNLLGSIGQSSLESKRVEVPFERITPSPEQWWSQSTASSVRVAMGPAGARKLQIMELGKGTSQHVLIAGKTGSGKSTLLHVLIMNIALTYSPDEIRLYLIDFKKGVEFKAYAGGINEPPLPHAQVIAIESEREFGFSVLQGLDEEIKRRGDLFRNAGVDSLKDYRSETEQKLPRLLLLVDEFQEFFTEDDRIASDAALILDRLVRQGRAFGVHIILGSQTLAGAYALSRTTMDQMAIRIALQCSDADSRVILADENGAARLLSRPGEAIYNDANGLIEGNNLFQVAWLSEEQRSHFLKKVQDTVKHKQYKTLQPPIVFEGGSPASIDQNQQLTTLLQKPSWSSVPPRRIQAWVGEPIAIKQSTQINFVRQGGSNALFVTSRDDLAIAMFITTIVSLAVQQSSEQAKFYILDFGNVDAPYAALLKEVTNALPHQATWGRRKQLAPTLGEISDELALRLEIDESELTSKPNIFLFVFGIQRARDLRSSDDYDSPSFSFDIDDDVSESVISPSKQFPNILREGPELGIFTTVWCDSNNNLNKVLDRKSLREFESRIVTQMNMDDSSELIDSPMAGKLGANRALYYSEELGKLEKFRPYSIPQNDSQWHKNLIRGLQMNRRSV